MSARRGWSGIVAGAAAVVLAASVWPVQGYVEAPYTLGRVVEESTNIVLIEVTRVNKTKNLIIYKKVEDLKGTHEGDEIKHNIGERGFHPREPANIMAWAEVGKRAVFFRNEEASETCIGNYWYQCYKEEAWWGLVHAEPYLLRTYSGEIDKLATAVREILKGKDVIITCLRDGNTEQLHERKGRIQRMRASLKRLEYDARRDFVGYGAEGEEILEFKTETLLAAGSGAWKFVPAAVVDEVGEEWVKSAFNDRKWRSGKAPIGYGEEEIANRGGTTIGEHGVGFVFRKEIDIPAAILGKKETALRLTLATDNSAAVWINGKMADDEGEADHEFAYWNREIELDRSLLVSGKNVIAVFVRNGEGSSDLYLDAELTAETPVYKQAEQKKDRAAQAAKAAKAAK